MKTIQLTQAQVVKVSDEDYEELNRYKWVACRRSNSNEFVATRTIFMSRQITNAPTGMVVDHINGDSLDNRRENLRICTEAENQHNRKKNKNGHPLYKGIHWNKRSCKWQARIGINGRDHHIGYFNSDQDAALAYDTKAREAYGKFAKTNFQ